MPKRPASQELEHDPILARKFSHFNAHSDASSLSVQNFALSILEHREWAKYVRKVTLTYSYETPYQRNLPSYEATTPEEKVQEAKFLAAIQEQKWEKQEATELLNRLMTIESPHSHDLSFYRNLPDAAVALLLPILPNVEHWIVGELDRADFVAKAIGRAKDGEFGSISVPHIEIRPIAPFSDGAWDGINWPAFYIYANLPSLQILSGRGIGGQGVEDGGGYYAIPSQACAVRQIHLKDCELVGTCVSHIINFSTGLQAFTYRYGGRAGDGGTAIWESMKIAKALSLHRLTLRSLDLDAERQLHYSSIAEETRAWMNDIEEDTHVSFENSSGVQATYSKNRNYSVQELEDAINANQSNSFFPNLTHLRIGINLALRFAEISGKNTLAEWFPPTLEELEIVGYRHQEDGVMAEVVRRREELFPNLKALRGVDEYIEPGKELKDEKDYIDSEASEEESGSYELHDD